MKELLYKLPSLSIIAFGLFTIIPFKYRGLLFVILFITTLLLVIKEKKITFTKEGIINSSTYLLFILSLIYVNDFHSAFKKLETMFSLLLIPFLFSNIWNLDKKVFSEQVFKYLIRVFYISTFIYTLIIFLSIYYVEYIFEEETTNLFFQTLQFLSFNKGDHPIYISAILALAILFSFKLAKNQTVRIKTTYIFLNLIILALILVYAKRSIIVALFLSSLLYFFLTIKKLRKRNLFVTLIVATLLITIFFIPNTKHRFIETVNTQVYQEIKPHNSTSHRFHIYKCSFEVFKGSPLIGYGIGDDKNELISCYTKYPKEFAKKKYNTHNQYLGIVLKTGIIGLIIFLFFIVYNYKIAIKNKDVMYLSFLVFFTVIMLFENVLERQNGVMLFAFFINYFAHRNNTNYDLK